MDRKVGGQVAANFWHSSKAIHPSLESFRAFFRKMLATDDLIRFISDLDTDTHIPRPDTPNIRFISDLDTETQRHTSLVRTTQHSFHFRPRHTHLRTGTGTGTPRFVPFQSRTLSREANCLGAKVPDYHRFAGLRIMMPRSENFYWLEEVAMRRNIVRYGLNIMTGLVFGSTL